MTSEECLKTLKNKLSYLYICISCKFCEKLLKWVNTISGPGYFEKQPRYYEDSQRLVNNKVIQSKFSYSTKFHLLTLSQNVSSINIYFVQKMAKITLFNIITNWDVLYNIVKFCCIKIILARKLNFKKT